MEISSGLEDVYIKHTALTSIDGEKGVLRYRGYNIEDLVEHSTFEEVAYLMLYGELPSNERLATFRASLEKGYVLPDYVKKIISDIPRSAEALTIYMTAFAAMSAAENDFKWSPQTDKQKSAEIIGHAASVVANANRHISGKSVVDLKPSGSYARSFLEGALDRKADAKEVRVMDRALILYLDHEVPASTTAALVACSTLSDMYSSVAAAVAALKGPLHGGAAESAYLQFDRIGSPGNVEKWFNENIIVKKQKLMGFGHRVYKTYDPRMKIFRKMDDEIVKSPEDRNMLQTARKLEEAGVRQFGPKYVFPNTDFYSGIAFKAIGFPVNMFTALFALSRTTGWLAHISEYNESEPRIMRPRALYTGPGPRELAAVSNK